MTSNAKAATFWSRPFIACAMRSPTRTSSWSDVVPFFRGHAYLQENHPGVTVLGARLRIEPVQLSELYRTATLFCLPARFEPFGLVLLEAMAHGVPCVASRVGGIPEILPVAAGCARRSRVMWTVWPAALTALLRDREHRETLLSPWPSRGRSDWKLGPGSRPTPETAPAHHPR